MTIGRRQIVGWGALGIGAFAIDGCAGALPWGRAPATGPNEVDRLLADLDGVIARLHALEPLPKEFGIKSSEPTFAQGHATCTHLLTTLCFMGTYRDVPETMWSEPRVEQRLAKALPQIRGSLRAARNHLTNMTEEDSALIDAKMKADPDFTMRIMERFDEYAKRIEVPIEQRTYLRTATAQLTGRFRFEGAKEVTSKLASQYDRALASRMSMLGMQPDTDHPSTDEEEKTEPAPLRARFRTHATPHDVHVATCALEPKVTIDGADKRIVLDWEEFRCPAPVTLGAGEPVRGAVHMEPGSGGDNVVNVVLYRPANASSDEALSASVVQIAEQLQRALSVTTAPPPSAVERLGEVGESCRTKSDCEGTLACNRGACSLDEDDTSSAKLITTTGKLAKWGAILLIPPICAIGVLVLLTCLLMVIVAGCMYAGGD
jgi:hypothetical protein